MKTFLGRMNAVQAGRVWAWIPIALLAALSLLCLVPDRVSAATLVVQAIHNFPASGPEPSHPSSGLVQAADGSFYGAAGGGATSSGTIYRMSAGGLVTNLFSFRYTNSTYPDGSSPGGLLIGNDGALYGTTAAGGASWNPTDGGYGTVFRLTTNGDFKTLTSFFGTNGNEAFACLTQGSDGSFYGTTQLGGSSNYGTVFTVTTNGLLTSLYSFHNDTNGSYTRAKLVQYSDGSFYGTAQQGGAYGEGTVFKISTNGILTTLASFGREPDGFAAYPSAGLVLAPDGNFYGTTAGGGTNGNLGTVFRVTPAGVLTSIFSFNGTNGNDIESAMTLASDGTLWGTTRYGGATYDGTYGSGFGTVFQITTNGALNMLISLSPATGSQPFNATLVESANHIIYGTTTADGAFGAGTVFRVVPPPPLFTSITQLNGTVTLVWTAIPNATYRVEYQTSLTSGSWTALAPDVTAVADTASRTDIAGSDQQRFYRVELLLP
jgi:uncharacterized repeat protein (TIGR03803 family)